MEYKLSEIFDLQMGKTPSRSNQAYWNSGNNKWISISDLSNSDMYINRTKECISDIAIQNTGIQVIPKDTVIMSFKLSIGKVAITAENMYSNEAIMAFHNKKVVDLLPEYTYYLFSSMDWDFGTNKAVMGKTLNKTTLSDVIINISSISKQKEIIERLNLLRNIITKRNQELEELDNLVKSRFIEMFKVGFPEDSLINICNIIDYRGKTPEKSDSGLPFITAKNIKMHHMSFEPREYISKEVYDEVMVRGFPQEGDVVFTTEAPLGNVCRIPHFDTEFYIGQRIVTFQTTQLNNTYLEYALSTEEFKNKCLGKSSGSTVTGIRVRLLEQLTIPVPPKELQDQFAEFVAQVDKSKFRIIQYTFYANS